MPEFYPYAKTQRPTLLKSLFVFALLFSSHFLFSQPVINSFSPVAAPVGTSVTITGSNFSTTAANNIVYFGAVKAPVTAATSTSLTVTVPTGASYEPITVTTNGLTGYAQQAFNVTFPLAGGISASSFTKSDLATGNYPEEVDIADVDGDGKSDVIVIHHQGSFFSIYQNNSTAGNVSFLPRVDIPGTNLYQGLSVADIDGDGKKDVIIGGYMSGAVIFRNTSTPGAISFAPQTSVADELGSRVLYVGDIDGDGKPDIAVPSLLYKKIVSVLRNTSTPGNISFATKVDFATSDYDAASVCLGDLDGDRKPDLLTGYYAYPNLSFSALRNTSTPGTISFAPAQNFATQRFAESFVIKDLDDDGKNEVVIANGKGSTLVSYFKNTSTPGTISLGTRTDIVAGDYPQHIKMNDIDGDGKPDLLTANWQTNTFSFIKNTSAGGTISFATPVQMTTGNLPWSLQSGDLNGDNAPDIVIVNNASYTISVYATKLAPVLTGFSPLKGGAGTTVTLTGKNFETTTSVTIGGIPVTSFNIVSSTTITAVIAAGSTGTIIVTTKNGVATIDGFGMVPAITSFAPASGPVGTTVTITGSGFNATAANNIVYFGAVKALVTAATSTSLTVTVPTGATYQPITVTTNGFTAFAQQPFNVTFTSSEKLSTSSYTKSELTTGNVPTEVAMGDLDGDGKSDLVVFNAADNNFSLFKNNSTPGNVSFMPKVEYPGGGLNSFVTLADIDSDGKLDLLFGSSGNPVMAFYVYRNTSTPGNISFAPKMGIAGIYSAWLSVTDVDGDGKPDVTLPAYNDKLVSVYRNTSTPGNISFAANVDFATGNSGAGKVYMGDLDGDLKPDLIAGRYVTSFSFSILRNTSTPGTISFAASQEVATPRYSESFIIKDLNNDGKNEVIVANGLGSTLVSVFKNISTPGVISLGARQDFVAGSAPQHMKMNDVDGDGLPDLLTANGSSTNYSILKNTSASGTISFAAALQYESGNWPWDVQSGDLDGDRKPDNVVSCRDDNKIYIFSSKSVPTLSGFTPTGGSAGTTVTLTGTNLDLTTAVTIGGIPVTSFNIVSSTTITAVIAAGSTGTITVTTLTGTASIDGFGQTPTIVSFAPAAGPIGSTVTITGTNFSSTASDNIVYFGTVKANVLSASTTTLTVKVPVGAAYQPISVTTNKLTAYSAVPYNVTFPGIGATFAANSLSAGINIISGYMPYDACMGDFDGDGKNDVIAANYGDNNISVFRNTSINGSISFAAKVDYSADYPYNIETGDLDGDGKLDIITSNSSVITVFRNTSTPGNISFTNMGTFDHDAGVIEFIITDLDLDGKPDIALAGTNLAIMKNTSSANAISFGAPVYFIVKNYQCVGISSGDLDGDGKPDIAITGTVSAVDHTGWFAMFRNTMVPGAPFSSTSFAAKIDVATNATSTENINIVDVDADGKSDILAGNTGSGTLFLYKNTSTTGNISLSTRISYSTGTSVTHISVDDLDGDGKPDVILPVRYQKLRLLRNTGAAGVPSLSPTVTYANTGEPYKSTTGDLDGDGKPDLVIANYSGDGFTVYRNQVAEPTVLPTGSSPVSGNIVNKLAVDGSVQLYNNTPYVQRHYDVLPDNNAAGATATVTLYFTQQEFNNFNAMANHGADLPAAPTDATGKANLRIYQYHGTSTTGLPGSYTGSVVAIDPVDTKIVWNETTEWWEVTFDITGFSGFFASNATFNYTAPTAPVITAGGATTFCAGGSVVLSSSATSGNQWYKNGSPVTNATGATLTVTASGTYAATATINGANSALSAGIVVTVNAIPAKPTIARNASQLVSSVSSGNQWYKDGAIINGANASTFTPTEAGNYSVIVIQNGCTSPESDKFNYTVTGVVDLNNNQFIRLSPNPVKDNMLLEYEMLGTVSLTIQIIDINGRICKTFTNKATGSQLSLAELNNGIYIANIFTANQKQRYTIRLIKQ